MGFYWYIVVDSGLEAEYKEDYLEWKKLSASDSGAADANEIKKDETEMRKIENFTQMASIFGPVVIITGIFCSLACCAPVFCCFKSYRRNLIRAELSPCNPANSPV